MRDPERVKKMTTGQWLCGGETWGGLLHCQSWREHSGEQGKTGQGVPGGRQGGLTQRAGEAAGRPWPIQREAGPSITKFG